MVSTKRSKKPFKNTKIRPAENVTRVEVGSPNPCWSTRVGSSWVIRVGRPTRAGSSWVVRPTRAGLPALGRPGSSARVVQPALVYPRWIVLGCPRGSFNPRWSTRVNFCRPAFFDRAGKGTRGGLPGFDQG
ncbi:hypothetical protein DY000_02030043 [Brassica cretica]|uniref:Uncharacterized protein n=1 Tax=Brassica cretica TaxID=69181 RepID=A0ABQ7DS26_BRACR|nr:hypothetical protein DY000_02030043 [Brassica cretica]